MYNSKGCSKCDENLIKTYINLAKRCSKVILIVLQYSCQLDKFLWTSPDRISEKTSENGQSLDNKRGNRFRSSLSESYDIALLISLEVTLQQAFQTAAVTSLVASHFVDGLQNAAFQAAYLQGRGLLACANILPFQRESRNIFLLEKKELSCNSGTSLVHLLTSF